MRRHHRPPLVPTKLQSVAVRSHARRQEGRYLLQVVQLNQDLVDLTVGKLAHYILVLVVRLLAGGGVLTAAGLVLIVLVHEVILVLGIIAANVDVAERVSKSVGRRGLEVLQKSLKCTWKSYVSEAIVQDDLRQKQRTQLGFVVHRRFPLQERHCVFQRKMSMEINLISKDDLDDEGDLQVSAKK